MSLNSRQLKAQRRHRLRSKAINSLVRSIAQMDSLPTEIFSPAELSVIHGRFNGLMQCWQAAHPEVMP